MSAAEARCAAFAPASVGNVAVGFDLLGHALAGPGDIVTAERIENPEVRIESIDTEHSRLPLSVPSNTASRAAAALLEASGWPFGVMLAIQKGIPLSSGMGGSAASAVAAVVAVNQLLQKPLPTESLLPFAVEGEVAASGSAHYDNVAPSLLGGLVLTVKGQPVRLPVPDGIHCALVHPDLRVNTRDARSLLEPLYELQAAVEQNAALAGFISACYKRDSKLLGHCMQDYLAEPRRSHLVPGFHDIKRAALSHGALGCSLSGSGPSLFAWCEDAATALRCGQAMVEGFASQGISAQAYDSPVQVPGARVVDGSTP